jgi:hypothetical protein
MVGCPAHSGLHESDCTVKLLSVREQSSSSEMKTRPSSASSRRKPELVPSLMRAVNASSVAYSDISMLGPPVPTLATQEKVSATLPSARSIQRLFMLQVWRKAPSSPCSFCGTGGNGGPREGRVVADVATAGRHRQIR